MKCRIDIKGQKVWVDNDNLYNTRPASTEIILFRDGEIYKSATVESTGDGTYNFTCLPVWKNSNHKYTYQIDEREVPTGYTKTTREYNITNTLSAITISGIKTWADNNNEEGLRPTSIMAHLFQNGVVVNSIEVPSPPDAEDTVTFTFGEMPFADSQGVPYSYTVDEDDIANYEKVVDGFNITNTIQGPTPFSFIKSNIQSTMALQGAEFEIRKNGVLIETAVSDANGIVSFSIPGKGTFQLSETQPPAGYMTDITIYEVVVAQDGSVTVDGRPASEFSIENRPISYSILLERATNVRPAYMAKPNTWPLHGAALPNLFMTDKMLITLPIAPGTVKWDYGIKDLPYFATGGYDITNNYTDGIPTGTNGNYTVYARFGNGYETTATINIDRIRDGSTEMPYLLIDYITAADLEPSVTGIGQFTMNYMQGDGIKLTQNYELFENVNMTEKTWTPLGTTQNSYPYSVIEGFSGSFEGNGQTITGLDLSSTDVPDNARGLFRAVIDGAVIQNFGISYHIACQGLAGIAAVVSIADGGTVLLKNLQVSNSKITNQSFAGGIVGSAQISEGSLNIDGCSSTNLEINNYEAGGGIIGYTNLKTAGTMSITNCNSYGSIRMSGSQRSGAGIAGQLVNAGKCSITNCVNGMSITGKVNLGGIIGYAAQSGVGNSLTVSSCCNHGNITGANTCGGIAGNASKQGSAGDIIIENCYNTGTINKKAITSDCSAGGLIGKTLNTVTLLNNYNVGDVIAESFESSVGIIHTGGISGEYTPIQNCAAINLETSSPQSATARIVPYNNSLSNLNNNVAFEDMRVLINGVQKLPLDIGSSGIDGINVSKMKIKTQALYETDLGWDFNDVWSFGNGAYILPVLRGIPLDLQPNSLPSHLV